MVDAIITFREGEDILASEANSNNQYILSKISDNAEQIQQYVESEIATVQSNVASVQATLQGNIDKLKQTVDATYYNISPNLKAPININSGWVAVKNGWINYRLGSSASFIQSIYINGKMVAECWQGAGDKRAGTMYVRGMVFIAKGEKLTGTHDGLIFYPCKGEN